MCVHVAGERKYWRGRNERERKKERGGVSSNASMHVLTISDVSNSSISSLAHLPGSNSSRKNEKSPSRGCKRVVLLFDSRNRSPLCRFFFSARVNRRTCAASSPPRAISMQRRRVCSPRFERTREGRMTMTMIGICGSLIDGYSYSEENVGIVRRFIAMIAREEFLRYGR